MAKVEGYAQFLELLPGFADDPRTPSAIRRAFTGSSGTWMPEVFGVLVYVMAADQLGDEAFFTWVYQDAARLFDRPLLRHLIKVVSPTLVTMGAARRWGALHQGTSLQADPVREVDGRMHTTGHLTFPSGLFPSVFAAGLAYSFRAAIEAARGHNVHVELAP